MKNKFLIAFLALSMGGFMACGGDDGGGGSTTELSEAQAEAVAEALSAGLQGTLAGFIGAPRLDGRLQTTVDLPDETVDCPVSGTADLSGSYTINDSTGEISFDMDQEYNECTSEYEGGDIVIESGSISVSADMSIEGTLEEPTGFVISVTETGDVAVSGDGLTAGTCAINVTLDVTVDLTDQSIVLDYSGTVCGTTISVQYDDSLDSLG